ncbi:MAG TPA: hypothetical protein VKM55_03565 [Candidatus Lokiarchaeia archaeon]|nr:hypothetical protein [Candidatus Lokiarchaeia archaeon]
MPDDEEISFDDLDKLIEPIDKDGNKATMIDKLQNSFNNGTPFIDYTEQYVFLAYQDGNKWSEFSFIREDGNLSNSKQDPETALHDIKEEIIRGLSESVEINANDVTAMANNAGTDPAAFIADVITNLPPEVPIIRNQDELSKAIDLVQSA